MYGAVSQLPQEGLLRAVTDAENEIAKLRSRIVRSPERVRDNVRSLEARIANLKLSISEHERKAQDHKARIDVLRKYEGVRARPSFSSVEQWERSYRTSPICSKRSMSGKRN